jgi:hypothetical protein
MAVFYNLACWLDRFLFQEGVHHAPQIQRPLRQIDVANQAEHHRIPLATGALSDVQVEQSGGRTDKYREFVLAVDNARDDPDELFDWAQSEGHPGETPGQSSGCLVSAFLERIV